jgi:hypothetical protein
MLILLHNPVRCVVRSIVVCPSLLRFCRYEKASGFKIIKVSVFALNVEIPTWVGTF